MGLTTEGGAVLAARRGGYPTRFHVTKTPKEIEKGRHG